VIQTLSRVTRSMDMPEKTKLDFLQVLGTVHMRILDGTDSLLQLSGCAPTLIFSKRI
jgi:replication factor C subunit 2/4